MLLISILREIFCQPGCSYLMILMNNVKTFYLVITCLCLIGMEKPSEMCVSSFMSGACQFLCS